MKRTNSTKLTEATLLRAVLERSGKPVAYKTLAGLEALGRPPRPAVETMCESLIERGYLVPAVAAKGNGVQATAKEHPGLWALLISEHLAGVDAARTADAAGARDTLRDLVSTSIFLKKAAREARCAWTRADDDLYGELAAQLYAWIAKQWETTPAWVARRRRSVETLCHCFDCREYGDGARRREHYGKIVQEPPAPDPALDPIEEAMTSEMEADLKTQCELQVQVEALGDEQEALAAQVALRFEVGLHLRCHRLFDRI